jgi:hypothetical protein
MSSIVPLAILLRHNHPLQPRGFKLSPADFLLDGANASHECPIVERTHASCEAIGERFYEKDFVSLFQYRFCPVGIRSDVCASIRCRAPLPSSQCDV